MSGRFDWGTWLSIGAVLIVCIVVAARVVPSAARDPANPSSTREAAAAQVEAGGATPVGDAEPGYRVNTPDATVILPLELAEISGLSAAKDPKSLWAVHDERGSLFRISIKDGSVLQEIPLGKRGDYEGVEEAGDAVYVARSEGVLLVVNPAGGNTTPEWKKLNFQMQIGLACDLEGLGFEPKKNRLLLTCKNESSKSRKSNKAFEIYSMDLAAMKVAKEPAYVLHETAIDDYIAAHPQDAELGRSKGKRFAPSGIAVHPQTGHVYVLSTRGKMIVVLDAQGALVRAYPLDPGVHPQPEGITFAADGTMYVSSEAHGKRAVLHTITVGQTVQSAREDAAAPDADAAEEEVAAQEPGVEAAEEPEIDEREEAAKKFARNANKDSPKDRAKNGAKGLQAASEKESSKAAAKEPSKDASKEPSKDASKEPSKDAERESANEAAKAMMQGN